MAKENLRTVEQLQKKDPKAIRASVLNIFNSFESRICGLLILHFEPKYMEDFQRILLNSSIIHYGGKVKAMMGLKIIDKKVFEKMNRLGSIRNAFAHKMIDKDWEGDIFDRNNMYLNPMNSAGEIKRKQFHELASEFFGLHDELDDLLNPYK